MTVLPPTRTFWVRKLRQETVSTGSLPADAGIVRAYFPSMSVTEPAACIPSTITAAPMTGISLVSFTKPVITVCAATEVGKARINVNVYNICFIRLTG